MQALIGLDTVASKKGFYASTPAVPAKKMADTNPVGKVESPGGFKPGIVPPHPGRTHALGPVLRQPKQHPGPHGYGHKAHQKAGPLRLSGVMGAHRVGLGPPKPPKV
jgi:hypothetical protein